MRSNPKVIYSEHYKPQSPDYFAPVKWCWRKGHLFLIIGASMVAGASLTCNVISYKVMSGQYQVTVVPPVEADYLTQMDNAQKARK